MRMKITPSVLSGSVQVPSSKSMTHRYLIAAGLCGGCTVHHVSFSQDIYATMRCLEALGMVCEADETAKTITVKPGNLSSKEALFDCGESGSTLRFFLPIALQLCQNGAKFCGSGRLMERPQQPYFDIFEQKQVEYTTSSDAIWVKGELKAGQYALSGAVSSQFVTGLLFALSLCKEGQSKIIITDELQSKAYVDMTIAAMRAFGVQVENHNYQEFIIPGGQKYIGRDVSVEADYSQAAFFLTAAYLGNPVEVTGLSEHSLQGDQAILSILSQLKKPGDITIDISEIPDLAPILATAAAVRQGKTHIVGGIRLRYKESDRILSTVTELAKLGADISERADGMEIVGKPILGGGIICCDSWNDHRIAMAVAIAATACMPGTIVYLTKAQAVEKSYPDFWEIYRMLGGTADCEEK